MCLVLTYLDIKFITHTEIQTKLVLFPLIDIWLLNINFYLYLGISELDTELSDIFSLI